MTVELRIVGYLVAWMWLYALIPGVRGPWFMELIGAAGVIGTLAIHVEREFFGRWWLLPKGGEEN